jgi:hypothetical protein
MAKDRYQSRLAQSERGELMRWLDQKRTRNEVDRKV